MIELTELIGQIELNQLIGLNKLTGLNGYNPSTLINLSTTQPFNHHCAAPYFQCSNLPIPRTAKRATRNLTDTPAEFYIILFFLSLRPHLQRHIC